MFYISNSGLFRAEVIIQQINHNIDVPDVQLSYMKCSHKLSFDKVISFVNHPLKEYMDRTNIQNEMEIYL